METTHTPWEAYKNGRKLGRGKKAPESWDVLGADGTVFVCDRVTEADARLIAAAPELLDAIRVLHEDWITLTNQDYCDENVDVLAIDAAVRQAIAKATGEGATI